MKERQIHVSATIEHGVTTNRVRVKRAAKSAGSAMARYRKDPTTRGLDMAVVCISIPCGELAVIDSVAEGHQMARSHFLRQAAKAFVAQLRKKIP